MTDYGLRLDVKIPAEVFSAAISKEVFRNALLMQIFRFLQKQVDREKKLRYIYYDRRSTTAEATTDVLK